MIESRILEVFSYSKLTRIDFAHKVGISNAVLSHLSSGRNKASSDLILNILTHFPDISSDWLLLGQGKMLRSSQGLINDETRMELIDDLNQVQKINIEVIEKLNRILEKINGLK